MAKDVPPGQGSEEVSPAEREARWVSFVRFAIEAASEHEAAAVLALVLAGLKPELPLRGQPVIHPRHRTIADSMWVAELVPDLTGLQEIHPDDAKTRCRFVQGKFPTGTYWSLPQNAEREAKCEWPPDIWQRQPGRDDVLLHPALRAVMIVCRLGKP